MDSPRVLMLDTPFGHLDRIKENPPVVTGITEEDIWDSTRGRYHVSEAALQLAKDATPDDYDFVIIGNNMGWGLTFAQVLHEELRPKTLVVWNSSSSQSESARYGALGYSHFGDRMKQAEWLVEQVAASSTN